MKLLVLVVFSVVLFRASCHERPDGRELNNDGRNLSDGSNLPDGSDLPDGHKDEASTVEPEHFSGGSLDGNSSTFEPEPFSGGPLYGVSSTDEPEHFSGGPLDDISSTDEPEHFSGGPLYVVPELVRAGFQNHDSSDIDHQLKEDGSIQNEHKLRGSLKKEIGSMFRKLTNTISELKGKLNSVEALISKEGCPEGTFLFTPSNQCFRVLNDTERTYDEAKAACNALGLQLAQPYDALSLASYLIQNAAVNNYVWLGARGDGSNIKWERNGQTIRTYNPLWTDGRPGNHVSTASCLILLNRDDNWKIDPNQPYFNDPCTNKRWTLCEHVME